MKFKALPVYAFLFFALVAFLGCGVDSESDVTREGYRPIYMPAEDSARIAVLPAQPLKQPGKIYSKDTLIFVNELNKGIHVINNKNPRSPQNIAFISIPGNVDMAVKGTILYADNFTDLAVLNIANPKNITLTKRVTGVLPQGIQDYPPYTNVVFECVDHTKGVVAGWEKTTLKNPRCRR